MGRDTRVRVHEEEKELVEAVRSEKYDEDVAEVVPLGQVIGDLAEDYLDGDTA